MNNLIESTQTRMYYIKFTHKLMYKEIIWSKRPVEFRIMLRNKILYLFLFISSFICSHKACIKAQSEIKTGRVYQALGESRGIYWRCPRLMRFLIYLSFNRGSVTHPP
jgi:hypothetical protein